MGLEYSRANSLPSNIDENFELYKSAWHEKTEEMSTGTNNQSNNQSSNSPTLNRKTLEKAGWYINEFFSGKDQLKILEIMSGNGLATDIVYDIVIQHLPTLVWQATELQILQKINKLPIEQNLDSVDAVNKFGPEHNTLLMISPPGGGEITNYGDYFAIREWTKLQNSKYIIFVGELGASDGSNGIYIYMLENKRWICELRNILMSGIDELGGPIEKEIFIFSKV